MLKSVYLEHLSWPEAEILLKEIPTAIIPIGAQTKEHGHHLPLNNDWILAEELTKRIAKKTRAIILPTVPYGFYPAFVEYPGSVNIGEHTFQEMLMDICRSLTRHGTKRCYFLNTGVSTLWPLEAARLALQKENIVMDYYNPIAATEDIDKKLSQQPRGTHADEMETSMMLYLAPKIVKMKLAKPDARESKGRGPLTRNPDAKMGVYSPTGAWGDPTLATKKKGKAIVDVSIKHILDFLTRFEKNKFKPEPARENYLR